MLKLNPESHNENNNLPASPRINNITIIITGITEQTIPRNPDNSIPATHTLYFRISILVSGKFINSHTARKIQVIAPAITLPRTKFRCIEHYLKNICNRKNSAAILKIHSQKFGLKSSETFRNCFARSSWVIKP